MATYKPCGPLPLWSRLDVPVGLQLVRGCRSSRQQQLNRQAIGALALALEICSVIGCSCFEPRDLRVQCLDLCRYGDVACLATTWWPGRMPYFSEINAYQGFAIIRKGARQPESLGKRTSGLARDFQAGT